MPTKPLPADANLDHLKNQARDLRKAYAAKDPQAIQRVREFHPRFTAAELTPSAAQFAIAREYGFESWARLRRRLENPEHAEPMSPALKQAVDLFDAGDAAGLRSFLQGHPGLVRERASFEGVNYFRNPTLLQFVAENPIRRGQLPSNIIELAQIILDAGAREARDELDETLGLVCSGRVPRECGAQIPLIRLLCDAGANPDAAMGPALTHGEFEAVNELTRHGARVSLPVAAATGRQEAARRTLEGSNAEERHRALALAAQFGHVAILRLLLDAGEDSSRYNPIGYHSHSTPLHQAALAGHFEAVRLLVERGALLDLRDTFHQGTPAGWAGHAGHKEIEAYLNAHARNALQL